MRPIIHAAGPRIVRPVTQADLLNGWTVGSSAVVSLIRVDWTVHLVISSSSAGLTGAAATDSRFLPFPVGWRPDAGNYLALGQLTSSGARVDVTKSTGYLACSARGLVQGVVSWPTADPMP